MINRQTTGPDRATAFANLAKLVADGLPVPEGVRFSTVIPRQLNVSLVSVDDFDAWAAGLGAKTWLRNDVSSGALHCRAFAVPFAGCDLIISACIALPKSASAKPTRQPRQARPAQDDHDADYGVNPGPSADLRSAEVAELGPVDPPAAEPERCDCEEMGRNCDTHRHVGRVSMRQASELCAVLNDFPSPGAADSYLRSDPKFARVLNADEYGRVYDAELVDGSKVTNSATDGWVWSR